MVYTGRNFTLLEKSAMAFFQQLQVCFQPSVLCLVFAIIVMLKMSRKRKLNLPPSPPKLPVLGNFHQLGSMPHLSLHSLAKKYGPIIYLQLGQIPTVVLSSAQMARELMQTHDLATASRPRLIAAKYLLYDCSDIAFSPYGPYWRHVRKIGVIELLSAKKVQSYGFVREDEVSRLVHRISVSYPGTTNLTKLLALYANNVISRVAIGMDFSEEDFDSHDFQEMLDDFRELLGGFSIGDFFPSMEFINSITGLKSRLQTTFQRFDRFFDEVIDEHLNKMKMDKRQIDLVDALLHIQKNESSDVPLTMNNIKAIILDMFAGGTATNFITLDWGMTELILNPGVMETAQAEVRRVVGERRVVEESDLPQLHYLKAVIKEILRLHPPAPVLVPRESMEDVTINGYNIPAKTRFFVNAWSIGRDVESWKNPETFQPERFLGSNMDYKGNDFELIPFGAGRRICPAVTFATATVELALAQLLHSFDWELPHGAKAQDLDLTQVFGISVHKAADLIVIAKPHPPQDIALPMK